MAETVILSGMSRPLWYDCMIDGQPVLAPDGEISLSIEDLDSEESGRDEDGYMHRVVLREGMMVLPLSYRTLNHTEFRYMESLFAGKPEFEVTYRDPGGEVHEYIAYRSKYGITLINHRTGTYKNYKFNIIEC